MQEWIPWAQPSSWGSEQDLVGEALRSTWISGGPFVERLERDFARCTGALHALCVSNGTTALHLAFLALGLQPGDEVVVPGFAFMAAANVALHMNARPVFADVDERTWCLSAEAVERCLSPRTRAIVPVHTYGNVCSMDEIQAVASARGIPVVEDAAEAFCSRYRGRHAGTLSLIGTYSFQATKTITTGEGGMVVTGRRELFDAMALYRSHGMGRTRYWHELPGHNFRLTNLQAALGCAQMEHLDRILSQRRRVHARYRELLRGDFGGRLQEFRGEVDPVLWAMAVKLEPRAYPQGRDEVMNQMKAASIETRPGFYAASQMKLYSCPSLPVSEDVASHVISLPTFPTLRDESIARIASTLLSLRR